MKRITLAFLTFLALIPSLMCFMEFCPMQSAQASEPIPCHEKSASNEDGGIMLISDCMGVDLFSQAVTQDFQPIQSMDVQNFVWADASTYYSFEPQDINNIHGPPSVAATSPSRPIYLTTQRLRI